MHMFLNSFNRIWLVFAFALVLCFHPFAQAQLKLNNPSIKPLNPPSSNTGTGLANPITNVISTPRDFIVAVVDSVPITNHDVNARLELQRTQAAQQGRAILKSDVTLRRTRKTHHRKSITTKCQRYRRCD